MASRPLISPHPVILNGNMAADITSAVTIISNISMIGYSYSWVGTAPIGTLTVEISNDYSQNADGTVRNPGTWTQIFFNLNGTPSNSAPVSGSPGNGFIDISSMSAFAIRTVYHRTSGTGVLQAVLNAKVQ